MAKKRKKLALGGQITGATPDIPAWIEKNQLGFAKAKSEAANHWGVQALNIASDVATMLSGVLGGTNQDSDVEKESRNKVTDNYVTKTLDNYMDKKIKPIKSLPPTLGLDKYSVDGMRKYASGGEVPIEAEGDEIVQEPFSEPQQLQGPSHEQGGIPLDVEEQTKIFSQRLTGPDGKTMAERKKLREKKISSLSKLASKNKFNEIMLASIDRTLKSLDNEEKSDMDYMESMRNLQNQQDSLDGAIQQYALGGAVDPKFEEEAQLLGMSVEEFAVHVLENSTDYGADIVEQAKQYNSTREEFAKGGFVKGMKKLGKWTGDYGIDILGGLSIMDGARQQLKNTYNMRANDAPVVDRFKDLQSSAEENFDRDHQNLRRNLNEQTTALNRQVTSAKEIARNSARGINQLRALNTMTDEGFALGQEKAYGSFLASLNQLKNERDRAKDEFNRVKAGAATNVDMRRSDNQDAFYSALAQNLADQSEGNQRFIKHVNDMREARAKENLLKTYSKYGIRFDRFGRPIDEDGNLINLKTKQ